MSEKAISEAEAWKIYCRRYDRDSWEVWHQARVREGQCVCAKPSEDGEVVDAEVDEEGEKALEGDKLEIHTLKKIIVSQEQALEDQGNEIEELKHEAERLQARIAGLETKLVEDR